MIEEHSGRRRVLRRQAELTRRMSEWVERAACRNMPSETFFPERGDMVALARAKAVCASCAVIDECRQFALENKELTGVWGGRGRGGKDARPRKRRPDEAMGEAGCAANRTIVYPTARSRTRVPSIRPDQAPGPGPPGPFRVPGDP